MSICDIDGGPVMANRPEHLPASLEPLADRFPDVHGALTVVMGEAMLPDGVMEFTLTELARRAGVRLGSARAYLKAARDEGWLHLLGRRTENGRMRYCAYRAVEEIG